MRWATAQSYLIASKRVPHRRHLYWSVIACVPKSEMTSASRALQCGQAGSARGLFGRGGRRVLLLLEAPQHAERVRVDRTRLAPAANRIPAFPVDLYVRRLCLQLLFQARLQLRGPHGQLAFSVVAGSLADRRAEPLDRFLPRSIQRFPVDAGAQPAAAVEEVVALFHEHLAKPVLQHFHRSADARLDHHGEGGVEDCVGGDELRPLRPRLVEVGEVANAPGVRFALGPARIRTQRLETAVKDAAVA